METSYCVIRILQNFPRIKLPPGEPQEVTGQEKQLLQYVLLFPQFPQNLLFEFVLFNNTISFMSDILVFILHGSARLTSILLQDCRFARRRLQSPAFLIRDGGDLGIKDGRSWGLESWQDHSRSPFDKGRSLYYLNCFLYCISKFLY